MKGLLATEARPVGRVLLTVWRACGRIGWVGAGLLGALLVLLLGMAASPRDAAWMPEGGLRRGLLIIGPALSGVLVAGFWLRLILNVMQQNDPQLARTVPGQVRALRGALCGPAVLVSGSAALISLSLGGPLWAVLAGVLVVLAAFATVLRWPLWGFGVMALSWSAPLLERTAGLGHLVRWIQAAPGLAVVIAIAGSFWVLAGVVMDGGPRHVAAHRRVRAMAGAMKGDFAAQAAQAALGKGPAGSFANPGLILGKGLYSRWLRHTLQRPAAGVLPRLALGLGPPQHWTGLISGLLVASVFFAVPLLLAWATPQPHGVRQMGMSMVAGTPLMMLAAALGWPPALWATRREQALLRLLPGVPQGRALNRWLALRLARQFLSVSVLTTAIAVACIRHWDLDFQWAAIEDFVLCCAALSPWMLLLLWRDWSAMRAPTGGWPIGVMGAVLGIGGTAWVWVSPLAGNGWSLAAFSALLFVPLARWRWRLAVQAPVAWPVGWGSGSGREPAGKA